MRIIAKGYGVCIKRKDRHYGGENVFQTLAGLAQDRRVPALVVVTHHVDEIPPGFTPALLLASGRIVAAGPVAQVLTRDRLSACFGLTLNVEHRRGRWRAWATGVADPL